MRFLVALALALAGLVVDPAVPAVAHAGPEEQVVQVTASADTLVASTTTVAAGVVTFAVTGSGSATLLRLRDGATLEGLYTAYAKALHGRPGPVRKLRKSATFHGGMPAGPDAAPGLFAVDLAPGAYHLADLAHGTAAPLEVVEVPAAAESAGRAPVTAGTVSYTPLGITMPRSLPPTGWMRVVNQGTQVSRLDVLGLEPRTTVKQVRAYFRTAGRKHRGRFTGTAAGTLLLSPDQRYWWAYSLPAGPVAAASSWPREKDGAPQAHHGMWGVTELR